MHTTKCILVCNVKLGSNCNIFPGTVLGSDGFGYAPTKNGYVKIEQLGSLVIGDNVEIGAGAQLIEVRLMTLLFMMELN